MRHYSEVSGFRCRVLGVEGESPSSLDTRHSSLDLSMETVACPDCDLLQRLPELPPGGKARCPRCSHTLATQPTDGLDRALALTLTAAIFIVAITSL
jgi:paraquat-inducible protein A